jgi:putative tryptophan/tyrosine transport system substrate-binding protein
MPGLGTKMRRRDFLALAGAAAPALALPLAAHAQSARVRRVGALLLKIPEAEILRTELVSGLRAAGYVEGQNIQYEFRSLEGSMDQLPKLAAELVALNADVIVALYTPCTRAAQQATRDIPIVALAGDLVGTGFVQSLSRPGGNITGVSMIAAELHGKCVELIRDMAPSTRSVALLASELDPFTRLIEQHVLGAGRGTGIEIAPLIKVRDPREIDAAFATMKSAGAGGVVVQGSLALRNVADLGLKHRLPTATFSRAFVEAGGLMGYGADAPDLARRVTGVVRRVLQGEKPAEIPVEQPTKFDLVVNLKTAKALDVTVSESFLLRANSVIE